MTKYISETVHKESDKIKSISKLVEISEDYVVSDFTDDTSFKFISSSYASSMTSIKQMNNRKRRTLREKFITYYEQMTTIENLMNNSLTGTLIYLYDINDMLKNHSYSESNQLSDTLKILSKKIEGFDANLQVDKYSLINYIRILASRKIATSEIAIDPETNKVIIFYNQDNNKPDSLRISIIPNQRDFTVAVLSRKDGLARFRGVFTPKFPEAYYKIESILEILD